MKFYFSVPVWGNNHLDLFLNVGIPSLLAPGNIPGMREIAACRFFIHTRPEDEARLIAAPSFRRLAKLMPVEIRLIRDPISNPYITMSACHLEIMRLAAADDVPAVFPSPDLVWSDGSMVRMERLAEAGKTAIHVAGVRLDRDSFVKSLAEWRTADGTLVIPARSLVALGLEHLHRIAHLHFWHKEDGKVGSQLNPANLFWRVENEGLVAHCFHLHPLMVHAEVRSVEFSGTIDDDLVSLACPDLSRQYVVPDSDEILNFEISGPEHAIPASCVKGSIESVCHWAIFQTHPLHHLLLRQGIRFHSTAVADPQSREKFNAVEKEANEIVNTIASIYGLPTWQLFIWHPSIFRARLEKQLQKIGPEEASNLRNKYKRYCEWYQAIYPLLRFFRVVDLDVGFYISRGEARWRDGDLHHALDDFSFVLKYWPDDAGVWSRSFLLRMQIGEPLGALADINRALTLSPNDPNLIVQHAEAAQALEMWDEALSDYRVVRTATPN